MTLPIHVARIGYGVDRKVFHAPLLQAVPGLHLVTIQSSRPAKVRADWPGVWLGTTEGVWARGLTRCRSSRPCGGWS